MEILWFAGKIYSECYFSLVLLNLIEIRFKFFAVFNTVLLAFFCKATFLIEKKQNYFSLLIKKMITSHLTLK